MKLNRTEKQIVGWLKTVYVIKVSDETATAFRASADRLAQCIERGMHRRWKEK